jgi:hypothetical protein
MIEKLFKTVVTKDTVRAAARLKDVLDDSFYLAGGTALALRHGHRVSLDLDIFSQTNQLKNNDRERILHGLRESGETTVLESTEGTLHLNIENTSVSLFRYSYEILGSMSTWKSLLIASDQDIAAMKLSEILGRGTKKDFIDTYVLVKKHGLKSVFRWGEEKFRDQPNFILQTARSLVYFDDAEKEPMPKMKAKISWKEVKTYFEKQVPAMIKKL